MTYDFKAFLQSLYPGRSYDIEALDGGLVNHTVRARRTDGDASTLVLKMAPPYVAALGEEAPFSQERQLVEAATLEFLEKNHDIAAAALSNHVKIPGIIHHDVSEFVLVMADLGPLMPLYEFFCPKLCDRMDREHLGSTCRDLGGRLGRFFAKVHSQATVQSVGLASPSLLFRNFTSSLVQEAAVDPIVERLRIYGGFPEPSATRLWRRVHTDYTREAYPQESCFSMGDFHPGSVLVNDTVPTAEHPRELAVIDWEFATASRGRGPNGDMAQFLASMHLLLLSCHEGSPTYDSVNGFIQDLCAEYHRAYEPPARLTAVLRSALILHGREIINQAVERDWGSDGWSVREMVELGAWYLERACDSVEEMMEETNWTELLLEDHAVMLTLFSVAPRN